MGLAHIVGVVGGVRSTGAGSVGRGHPTMAVDIVVVGAGIACAMGHAGVGVVRRDVPDDGGYSGIDAEAQVLGCVVHPSSAVEPHALQVEGHVDFLSSIGVIAEEPNLIVGGIHALHPDIVDEDIGLNLIVIATIDH